MFGVDLDKLPAQFEAASNGRYLISDADEAIYLAASTTNNINTAKRRFVQEILTQQFLAKAQFVRVHMTTRDSWKGGRFDVQGAVKPYQGNRVGVKKPPLVEPLRQVVGARMLDCPDEWYINLESELEADDTCMVDSYVFKENGVLYSADKDLRCTPYPILDPKTNSVRGMVKGVGRLWWHQNPSGRTLLGHGPIFFWAQCLMGDTADNIAGLVGCGPKRTYDMLEEYMETECEATIGGVVLDAYKDKGQDLLPEAQLLWMRPEREFTFLNHLESLKLAV